MPHKTKSTTDYKNWNGA